MTLNQDSQSPTPHTTPMETESTPLLNEENNDDKKKHIMSFFAKPEIIQKTNQKKKNINNSNSSIMINNKIPYSKTLDEQHIDKINYYKTVNDEIIPELMNKKSKMSKNTKNSIIINEINKKINDLKNEEKDYLLKNSKYIFQYYEEKKSISTNTVSNGLHSFFTVKTNTENTVPNMTSNKNKYETYWKNVNNEILPIQNYIYSIDYCNSCKIGELISQEEDGILICNNPKCCIMMPYIVECSKPSNKEPPNEVSYTAYIRLNHFKEILSQFQAKETTQIPAEVIDAIKARIKKERITDMSKINYHKMREILRKLNYNKYFEHIQYINSLFGIKPPIMNEELYDTLCMLFIEIQQPWTIHNPPHRRNFFNYTYTLHQLCVLVGQTQYLPFIPMMKDREKQLEQDMIWKKVCGELKWQYIPTL